MIGGVVDLSAVVDVAMVGAVGAGGVGGGPSRAAAIDLSAVVDVAMVGAVGAGGAGGGPSRAAVVDLSAVVDVVMVGAVGAGGAGGGPSRAAAIDLSAIVDVAMIGAVGAGGAGGGPVLICPVGAVMRLMAGADPVWSGGVLYLREASGPGWVVASAGGRRMRFRSVETAARWVELVIVRAASEVGLAAALPAERRERWKAQKVQSLAGYQDRLIESAAKVGAGAAQSAILAEYAAVQAKIDGL